MITKFDKVTARMIATEIEAAVQAIAQKHNVEIRRGGGTFDETNFTMKLAISIIDNDGKAKRKEDEDLKRYATVFGLPEDVAGKTFIMRGQIYTVVALKTKNHAYPVIAERQDGKRFKFAANDVVRLLNK